MAYEGISPRRKQVRSGGFLGDCDPGLRRLSVPGAWLAGGGGERATGFLFELDPPQVPLILGLESNQAVFGPVLIPAAPKRFEVGHDCGTAGRANRPVGFLAADDQPMTTYNAAQAAKLCAVSTRTIYRRAAELESHGAWRDASGEWNIPVEALIGVGLRPGRPARPDTAAPVTTGQTTAVAPVTTEQTAVQPRGDISVRQRDRGATVTGDTGDSELEQLRSQVTELRRRAEVAELARIELQTQADRVPDLVRRAEVAETASAGWQRLAAAHEKTILALEAPRPSTPQSPSNTPWAPASTVLSRLPLWPLLDRLRRS